MSTLTQGKSFTVRMKQRVGGKRRDGAEASCFHTPCPTNVRGRLSLCDSWQCWLPVSQRNQTQELSGENPVTLVRETPPASCPGNQVSTAGKALPGQQDVRVPRGRG